MAFPIAAVGVVGAVKVVGAVAGGAVVVAASHSDHSDYSDAARRREKEEREQKRKETSRKIEYEENRLRSSRALLSTVMNEAIEQLREEYDAEGMEAPETAFKKNADKIETIETQEDFTRLMDQMSDTIKKNIDKKLASELAEKQKELARINALLERVNFFRLTKKTEGDESE